MQSAQKMGLGPESAVPLGLAVTAAREFEESGSTADGATGLGGAPPQRDGTGAGGEPGGRWLVACMLHTDDAFFAVSKYPSLEGSFCLMTTYHAPSSNPHLHAAIRTRTQALGMPALVPRLWA
jgi:hypothetical protein